MDFILQLFSPTTFTEVSESPDDHVVTMKPLSYRKNGEEVVEETVNSLVNLA